MTSSQRIECGVEGGALSVLHFPNPDAPVLVFAHANGFNAGTYRQLLEPLAGHFEIFAPDLRGHGLSTAPTVPQTHRNWHTYARDLAAVAKRAGERPLLLAGHSMGAVAGVLAAGEHGLAARRLALIEPVIMPGFFYGLARMPFGNALMRRSPLYKGAISRRADWPDRDAAARRYRRKTLFADWQEGVIEDYLETGLIERDDGLTLSCAPAWEAANFASHAHDVWAAVRRLDMPRAVLKGAGRDSTVRVSSALRQRGFDVDTLHDTGHLAPQAKPQACADWLLDQAADLL